MFVNGPASTVSLKDSSANLNTALAAFSGTTTVSLMSLGKLLDSLGVIEVAGTEQTQTHNVNLFL